MALVKCSECSKEISSDASKCPLCCAKQNKKVGIVGIVVAVALLALVVKASLRTSTPDSRTLEQIAAAAVADKAHSDRMSASAIALRTIKMSLRDPDSVKWASVSASKDATIVCVEYRAKNGFGGMNLEYATAVGVVVSTKPEAWNKHCIGKSLYNTRRSVDML